MGLALTSLQDVFKNKVKDSINVPTVWIDSKTGEEHYDFKYTHVRRMRPEIEYVTNKPFVCDTDILYVRGNIKHIGSHVLMAGPIAVDENHYQFPIQETFRYAKSLEEISSLFYYWDSNEFIIPEDLLWNCPKLKKINDIFKNCPVKVIPSKLFAKCPELLSMDYSFYNTKITEIPEDLFNNNLQLTDMSYAFSWTKVKKIPEHLFDPIIDNIIGKKVQIGGFVYSTPLSETFTKIHNYDKKEQANRRARYFPQSLPRKFQYKLISISYSDSVPSYF